VIGCLSINELLSGNLAGRFDETTRSLNLDTDVLAKIRTTYLQNISDSYMNPVAEAAVVI
jgi:hypothetical protein